jgi:cytochrome c-type biogenesis protein
MSPMAGLTGGDAPLAFALSAGVITAFNPCGFAMLPAYVSYFVGTSDGDAASPLAKRVARAAGVGAVVTLGFVTVFGLIGLLTSGARSRVNGAVPYVSVAVGIVLVVLGVAMVRGYEPKLPVPALRRSRRGSDLRNMYVYGLSYAIVSLSCGFAGFTTAVVSSFQTESVLAGTRVFVAFALGMGLVLVVLSFAIALAQQAFVRAMRRVLPYVNRTSGALLVLAGLYVAYYGYYEWRTVVRGDDAPEGPVAWVTSWSASAQRAVDGLSTGALVAAVVLVAAVIAACMLVLKRKRATA